MCPLFNGDRENMMLVRYRRKELNGKEYKCPRGKVLMNVGSKAFESVYDVSLDGLSKEDCVKKSVE